MKKGDSVILKYNIDKNEDDGEFGYSINQGEIGEIKYIVPSTINDKVKIYMIEFSNKRYTQLSEYSLIKCG